MRKKIFLGAMALVLGTAAFTTYFSMGKGGETLLLQNVEALARGEGGSSVTCVAPWVPGCTYLNGVSIPGTRQ